MRKLIVFSISFLVTIQLFSQQEIVIDQVVAVVGGDKVLSSEIEEQAMQMKLQGYSGSKNMKCDVLEEILAGKLLVDQAKIDSIEISSTQVDSEIDRRINYFIQNIGSVEEVEKYFTKSMNDIKEDLRKVIGEQMLIQRMQTEIVKNVFVTPTEVKKFYEAADKDTLPLQDDQMIMRQIVIYPQADEQAKIEVRKKLLALRERIVNGEKFSTLAILYSEDPGSARKGGELGYSTAKEYVKPFADAAFALKEGQVSQIIETEFGFHIIQMIDRKGDRVNLRHILMKPKITPEMIANVKSKLDSIATLIKNDSLTFEQAAMKFSEDKETFVNGGLMINPYTRSSKFSKEHLSPEEFYIIKNLETNVISQPFEAKQKNKVAYKIIEIVRRIPSHRANFVEDYDLIVNISENKKKQEELEKWIDKKREKTYIKIEEPFNQCEFKKEGWVK